MATSKQIQQFLESLDPVIRKAFLADIELMRQRSNIDELEAAVTLGSIEPILFAAGVRISQWSNLAESVRNSYRNSGIYDASINVPAKFGFTFDMTNPRAQRWISEHSSKLVVELNLQQREAVQQTIAAGFGQGRNPRSIALDIVGRVSAQTGKRTGGVIGLHSKFSDAVINARNDLTNLDPNYFTRTRRDKRFDATVRKAIESGKPLPKTIIDRIVTRYEDRLLQSRAETIAKTEALTSMNAAGDEAMNQVVQDGLASADAIINTWNSTGERIRKDHLHASGQVRKHGEAFFVGGYQLMYPGDRSLGAPGEQIINCKCILNRSISFERTVL